MRIVLPALLLAHLLSLAALPDEVSTSNPRLLLSAKLLRRLKRDRERQTSRWTAFDNRVKTVPDSPERGFELSLYVAVTGDESRAKEAITWAAAHPCERRQRALIRDWVGGIAPLPCPVPASLRDQAFEQISAGGNLAAVAARARTELIPQLAANGITNYADLYALVELLSVLRANGGDDVRSAASQFFRNLPVEFLLSLKPEQVEKPDWIIHITALALVTVDPNLESSQFLQGWAIEDRQTLHEGAGVAYELLWADPYLPGIAYQNLDPWFYDPDQGRLFARSDWSTNACWISISRSGIRDLDCPGGWREKQVQFGSMTLIPMADRCLDLGHQDTRRNLLVWKLSPGEALTYRENKQERKEIIVHADLSGMWHPGVNVENKVCRR